MLRLLCQAMCLLLLATPVRTAASSPVERLAEAVRFKTVSYQERSQIDYAQFQAFHQFLRANYPRVFDQLAVEVVNQYSLLMRWPGSDPGLQPVLFTAHMDVVPIEPGTLKGWEHPPFAGVVADGRIYGRGTLDDKMGLLGIMEAAEQLLAEGFKPRRSLVLAFGHDEEISGQEGAVKIAERMRELGLHFEWMVDEGGMLVSDNPLLADKLMAMVNIAEKGYLTLTLVATGAGGHSSNPPRVSTIGRLSAALARIEDSPFPPRLVKPVVAMFEALAPHVDQPERLVFQNLWLTGGFVARNMEKQRSTLPFVRTTTALTMFNAGVKENVVPQRAEAKINFRLLPGDTIEGVISYIEEIVDDPLIEISYESWSEMPPIADSDGLGFAVIKTAVETIYPQAVVVPSMLTATTDTRHYIDLADNLYRFHGVQMATSQAKTIHGTNEYIDVQSYEKSIEIVRQMLLLGARQIP